MIPMQWGSTRAPVRDRGQFLRVLAYTTAAIESLDDTEQPVNLV
jgi:hypothetical protein